MVKLLSYLCKHGGLTYSLVLPQEGSKRKSSDPASGGTTRSRRQEAEGLAKKFTSSFNNSYFLLKFPSIIFFRTIMNNEQ